MYLPLNLPQGLLEKVDSSLFFLKPNLHNTLGMYDRTVDARDFEEEREGNPRG